MADEKMLMEKFMQVWIEDGQNKNIYPAPKNNGRNLSEEQGLVEEPLEGQILSQDTYEVTKSFLCIESPCEAAVAVSTSLRSQNKKNTTQREGSDTDETISMARAYRQEMMAQLLMYSSSLLLVYLLIYMSAVAIVLLGSTPHPTHYSFAQFLFPLQGLFNIIIYLRPAARITRIRGQGTTSWWIKAYYLVIKNGGEALKEQRPLAEMVAVKPPTSVKFGVENPPPKQVGESFHDVSNEQCMYVDSSIQLSRDNVTFNSSQDWYHIVGSEGEISQEPQDVFGCIYHNDLDMVVEESDENSQQLVSSESKS
ncbi:predicted protein [Chaetoceros tenuissimus]|uniref:Uncharacterized protein n=1 Tax=Chaetoceros tenuissimus TaxID=426638 RepID=A0AAD3H2P4_9STRA|nr:predicted protein [Chaetoceros tenuissimus]